MGELIIMNNNVKEIVVDAGHESSKFPKLKIEQILNL